MSMQDKILAAFRSTVETADPDLEVVEVPQFANTGDLYVQPRGRFSTLLQIRYAFHDGYCTIGFSHHALEAAEYLAPHAPGERPWIKGEGANGSLDGGPTWFMCRYTESDRIELMLRILERMFTKGE